MQRGLYAFLVILALVPAFVFGAGKIRGKVTDAGTGEPLVGANVVVVGTSMGAATNLAGEFVILNVPPGTFTLRTSYVGYQSITISNNRVNNELTTEVNFQLPAEGVTVSTVEIIAERPLINKSATNAVRIVDQEFFDKIPARGINAALAVQPGVIVAGENTYYIRGGRPDEVGFRVEGVNTTNVISGGSYLYTTAEAIEQIQVQAGGYSAEYGGANAGIVQSQLRTGSPERWRFTILGETDRYSSYGSKALGGYNYGYGDVTATAGGPILGKTLRFFGSAQNTFYRDPTVSVREAYTFPSLITDKVLTPAHPTVAKNDTLGTVSVGGNAIGGMDNRWAFSGTLLLDQGSWQLRGAGSYSTRRTQNTTTFGNYLNTSRLPVNDVQNGFGNLKLTYLFSPTTFIEVNGNYVNSTTKTADPQLGDDLFAYGDSAANARLGYYLYRTGQNYGAFGFYNGQFGMNQPGTQINGYSRTKMESFGGKVDFTTQMKQHEIKIGGEFTQYTYRRYNPVSPISWAKIKQDNPGANQDSLGVLLNRAGGSVGADIIGYDIYGNEVDGNVTRYGGLLYTGPRKPVFSAIYLQDRIEFSDIILNLGLRWDYIDPNSFDTPDPGNVPKNSIDYVYESAFINTEKTSTISPRIGFSFPISDRTVFHAQYGKFVQESRLQDSYRGPAFYAGNIQGGYWVTNTWGWGLMPMRTTMYELGFSQVVSDNASFDITAFYKDILDQIQFTQITPSAGSTTPVYSAYLNSDFSTAKGLEFKFTLRRTERVSAQINYTFMDARSTASNQTGSNGIYQLGIGPDALPKMVFPTDFDYQHRGAVLLDYRFGKNDGGAILQQLGLNLALQFNSGHAFTRLQMETNTTDQRNRIPVESIGSSTTPWFFQLDGRLDKTVAIGPLDVNFYIYVINILGTDNANNAWLRTGDPKSDGYFQTAGGSANVATLGPEYVSMYNQLNLGRNSGNFGPPRQIRFGLRLDI
jgi:hypothetical protein